MIQIETYSDKAIVVVGNTLAYKDQFKLLGGKWNWHLKDGKAGWIFSAKKHDAVKAILHPKEPQAKEPEPGAVAPNVYVDDVPPLEHVNEDTNNFSDTSASDTSEAQETSGAKRKRENNHGAPRKQRKQRKQREQRDEFRYSPQGTGVASVSMIEQALQTFVTRFFQITKRRITDVFWFQRNCSERYAEQVVWDKWVGFFKASNNIDVVVESILPHFRTQCDFHHARQQLQDMKFTVYDIEHQVLRPSIQDCFDMDKCRKEAAKYVKSSYEELLQLRAKNGGYMYQSLRQRVADLKTEMQAKRYQLLDEFDGVCEVHGLRAEMNAIQEWWKQNNK